MFQQKLKDGTNAGTGIGSDAVSDNQKIAKEWQNPTIGKVKKREVYSSFKCRYVIDN